MNSVDKVKKICKERKIPISKLEKDLGFANGYIGQLRKGTFPTDRVVKIADYLGVSVKYLMGTENTKKEKPTDNSELSEAKREFIDFVGSLSDEEVGSMLRMMKSFHEEWKRNR